MSQGIPTDSIGQEPVSILEIAELPNGAFIPIEGDIEKIPSIQSLFGYPGYVHITQEDDLPRRLHLTRMVFQERGSMNGTPLSVNIVWDVATGIMVPTSYGVNYKNDRWWLDENFLMRDMSLAYYTEIIRRISKDPQSYRYTDRLKTELRLFGVDRSVFDENELQELLYAELRKRYAPNPNPSIPGKEIQYLLEQYVMSGVGYSQLFEANPTRMPNTYALAILESLKGAQHQTRGRRRSETELTSVPFKGGLEFQGRPIRNIDYRHINTTKGHMITIYVEDGEGLTPYGIVYNPNGHTVITHYKVSDDGVRGIYSGDVLPNKDPILTFWNGNYHDGKSTVDLDTLLIEANELLKKIGSQILAN